MLTVRVYDNYLFIYNCDLKTWKKKVKKKPEKWALKFWKTWNCEMRKKIPWLPVALRNKNDFETFFGSHLIHTSKSSCSHFNNLELFCGQLQIRQLTIFNTSQPLVEKMLFKKNWTLEIQKWENSEVKRFFFKTFVTAKRKSWNMKTWATF